MQCKRASFTSLREVLQIATVRRMNAWTRTIADRHHLCTGKGTFTDSGPIGYGVYTYVANLQRGGQA